MVEFQEPFMPWLWHPYGCLQEQCEFFLLEVWCHNFGDFPSAILLLLQCQASLHQTRSLARSRVDQALLCPVLWKTCRYWPGVLQISAAGPLVLFLTPTVPGQPHTWQQAGVGWSHHCRQGWSGVGVIGIWLCWPLNAKVQEGAAKVDGTDDASLVGQQC